MRREVRAEHPLTYWFRTNYPERPLVAVVAVTFGLGIGAIALVAVVAAAVTR